MEIPTPDQIKAEVEKTLNIDMHCSGIVNKITKAIENGYRDTSYSAANMSPLIIDRIKTVFQSRGYQIKYTDDQRDGAFLSISW